MAFGTDNLTGSRRGGKSPGAFRTISEVSNDLEIPPHVLRFWETKKLYTASQIVQLEALDIIEKQLDDFAFQNEESKNLTRYLFGIRILIILLAIVGLGLWFVL